MHSTLRFFSHFELHAEQGDILELDPLVRVAKRQGVRNFPIVAVDHAKKDLELVARDKWQVNPTITRPLSFEWLTLFTHCLYSFLSSLLDSVCFC